MLDGLVVAAGREREQPGGHPAPGREPQVGGSSQCRRDPRATGGLVAEQCLDPGEEAERLHPIAARAAPAAASASAEAWASRSKPRWISDITWNVNASRSISAVARIASPGGSGAGGLAPRVRSPARRRAFVRMQSSRGSGAVRIAACSHSPRLTVAPVH